MWERNRSNFSSQIINPFRLFFKFWKNWGGAGGRGVFVFFFWCNFSLYGTLFYRMWLYCVMPVLFCCAILLSRTISLSQSESKVTAPGFWMNGFSILPCFTLRELKQGYRPCILDAVCEVGGCRAPAGPGGRGAAAAGGGSQYPRCWNPRSPRVWPQWNSLEFRLSAIFVPCCHFFNSLSAASLPQAAAILRNALPTAPVSLEIFRSVLYFFISDFAGPHTSLPLSLPSFCFLV